MYLSKVPGCVFLDAIWQILYNQGQCGAGVLRGEETEAFMLYDGKIWVGTGDKAVCLLPQILANRHGLIAGATGTGQNLESLKVLAEGFSEMGVPVFLSDVKGDLSGMVRPGEHSDKLAARLAACGVTNFQYKAFPTVFWDGYGAEGHPVRATISGMGPHAARSRMLGLNDTQAGVLNILFRVADDEGMLLLDVKDLKAMLAYVGEHAKEYTLDYGNGSRGFSSARSSGPWRCWRIRGGRPVLWRTRAEHCGTGCNWTEDGRGVQSTFWRRTSCSTIR